MCWYTHNIVCKAIALLSEGLAIADLQMRQLNHTHIQLDEISVDELHVLKREIDSFLNTQDVAERELTVRGRLCCKTSGAENSVLGVQTMHAAKDLMHEFDSFPNGPSHFSFDLCGSCSYS